MNSTATDTPANSPSDALANSASDPAQAGWQGATRLQSWGVIRASGPDAAAFLHGQLTQDVAQLGANQARLAGYCTAKGRLLASFVLWREGPEDILLACSADLLAPTLKRLSMFVLRSRCKLSDATAAYALYGLWAELSTAGVDAVQPPRPAAAWSVLAQGEATIIRLPDAQLTAKLLNANANANANASTAATSAAAAAVAVAPVVAATKAATALRMARGLLVLEAGATAPTETPGGADFWRWLEVHSGVARIMAATVEQFVPQMVNLELTGGVNFQKGCYPGQEIVARSQYRGTLKRRMQLMASTAALTPGAEVFFDADPGQPAGMVVLAASLPGAAGTALQHAALLEIKVAALQEPGQWTCGDAQLTPGALPYPLPTEPA